MGVLKKVLKGDSGFIFIISIDRMMSYYLRNNPMHLFKLAMLTKKNPPWISKRLFMSFQPLNK